MLDPKEIDGDEEERIFLVLIGDAQIGTIGRSVFAVSWKRSRKDRTRKHKKKRVIKPN